MGKVLKIGIVLVVLLVAALAASMWWVSSHLDDILVRLIREVGSEAAGVAVTVDDAELSLREGRGSIRGLTIANPSGYESEHAIRFEQIDLALEMGSLGTEVLVIDSIDVLGATVFHETIAGRNNLRTIMDHAESAGESSGAGGGQDVAIRTLTLSGSEITMIDDRIGANASLDVPEIVLTGLGNAEGGATPEDVARQILDSLIAEVMDRSQDAAVESLEDRALDELRNRLGGE